MVAEMRTEIVPVELPSGQTIHVQASVVGKEEDVAFQVPKIDGLTDAIEGVSQSILDGLRKLKPKKATVQFGIEVGLESGKLTALLVKGTGNASITVTLEWSDGG